MVIKLKEINPLIKGAKVQQDGSMRIYAPIECVPRGTSIDHDSILAIRRVGTEEFTLFAGHNTLEEISKIPVGSKEAPLQVAQNSPQSSNRQEGGAPQMGMSYNIRVGNNLAVTGAYVSHQNGTHYFAYWPISSGQVNKDLVVSLSVNESEFSAIRVSMGCISLPGEISSRIKMAYRGSKKETERKSYDLTNLLLEKALGKS